MKEKHLPIVTPQTTDAHQQESLEISTFYPLSKEQVMNLNTTLFTKNVAFYL